MIKCQSCSSYSMNDDPERRLCDNCWRDEQIVALRRDLSQAVDALQELYDWQNGCPLPTYEKGWGNAMEMARKVLKKAEARESR